MTSEFDLVLDLCNSIDKKFNVHFVKVSGCYVIFCNNKQMFIVSKGIIYVDAHYAIKGLTENLRVGYPFRASKLYYIIESDYKDIINEFVSKLDCVLNKCFSIHTLRRAYNNDKRRVGIDK